jgi:hypothetical protein
MVRRIVALTGVLAAVGSCRPPAGSAASELRPDEVAAVRAVWVRYLESKGGYFDCRPSGYWLLSEQAPTAVPGRIMVPPCPDQAGMLTGSFDQYEVLDIRPESGAGGIEYRIRTRFVRRAAAVRDAIVTVFAVREGDEWRIGNALPRLTRDWRRATVPPFTYVYPPSHRFSASRARQAVAFADSLARVFAVPPLAPITYYLAEDGDAMLRLFGYESDTVFGTPGGRSGLGLIVSGDAVFGEFHGHEIAHAVLRTFSTARTTVVASEGVATWLGGSRSLTYPETRVALKMFLLEHPTATVDSLIARSDHPLRNAAAALLADVVHRCGGPQAVRTFMDSGQSLAEMREGVARVCGRSWEAVADIWQARGIDARQ